MKWCNWFFVSESNNMEIVFVYLKRGILNCCFSFRYTYWFEQKKSEYEENTQHNKGIYFIFHSADGSKDFSIFNHRSIEIRNTIYFEMSAKYKSWICGNVKWFRVGLLRAWATHVGSLGAFGSTSLSVRLVRNKWVNRILCCLANSESSCLLLWLLKLVEGSSPNIFDSSSSSSSSKSSSSSFDFARTNFFEIFGCWLSSVSSTSLMSSSSSSSSSFLFKLASFLLISLAVLSLNSTTPLVDGEGDSLVHEIPVEHSCIDGGRVSGSHWVFIAPWLSTHSTDLICMPVPHDEEHLKGEKSENLF